MYGVRLADYLVGRRPAWEALALIQWLPRGSAYQAMHLGRNPDLVRAALAEKRPPDPVREWFEWDRASGQLAAVWDLLAQVNSGKGRAPTYPTPLDTVRKRARELRPVDPAAFEALQAAANTTQ